MSHADTLRAQIAYFDSWTRADKRRALLAALRSELAECEEVGEKWSVGAATDPKDGALILKVAPPPAPKPASPDKAPTEARPTHVRVTGRTHDDRHVTIGKVYAVLRWNDDGSPDVTDDDGSELSLSKPDGRDVECWPTWEPAPAPGVEGGGYAKWNDEARAAFYENKTRLETIGEAFIHGYVLAKSRAS